MRWKLIESATKYKFNDKLNPVLWINNKLKPGIKLKILELVEEFKLNLDIPLKVLDIEIVGSNASYNYTSKSDIDVHIITNFDDYGYPEELVQAAMNSFKTNFNKSYDVQYKGYDVELYVEDVKSSPQSNGIYSVLQDKWIKMPSPLTPISVELEPLLSEYENKINKVLKSEDASEIDKLIDELYVLRRTSLLVDGEFGVGNLVFKEIRNEGLLDELKDRKVKNKSKELSVESWNKIKLSKSNNSKYCNESFSEPNLIVYNGVDEANFDYNSINMDNCKEVGIHCGTLKCAQDRGHQFIYKLIINPHNIYSVQSDVDGYWSSMEILPLIKDIFSMEEFNLLKQSMMNVSQGDTKYYELSRIVRNALINKGIDAISYINEVEDRGSISYIILDKSIIKDSIKVI